MAEILTFIILVGMSMLQLLTLILKREESFFTNYTASLFANSVLKNKYNFRIGGTYEYFRFKSKTEGVVEDSISNFNSYGDLFISFNADSRDRAYFSTKGVKSELKAVYVMPLSKDWVSGILTNSVVLWLKL